MDIAPNTTIKLLTGVPLDPTYDHTIFFPTLSTVSASRLNQANAFSVYAKYTLDSYSYQRTDSNVISVRKPVEDIIDCNYLMFKNSSFENKWFYAFITTIEYQNNGTSRVHYEIDQLQTWFFDYTLDQCFVEREHSATDNLFENLVEEGLNLGETIIDANYHFSLNDMGVCILRSRFPAGAEGPAPSRTWFGLYTPVEIALFDSAATQEAVDEIDLYLNDFQEDGIICIYQFPLFMLGEYTIAINTRHRIAPSSIPTSPVKGQIRLLPHTTSLDGYTPNNKKLFSYPFNFITLSNNSGQTADYRWEDWTDTVSLGTFNIEGVFSTTPATICYPLGYQTHYNDAAPLSPQALYDIGVTYTAFPLCAWTGDTFKAWWAQNKTSITTGIISSVISTAVGMVSGAAVAAIPGVGAVTAAMGEGQMLSSAAGGISDVLRTLGKIEDMHNMPNQTHGQVQVDSLNIALQRQRFTFYFRTLKAQNAKIIDDFFSRYGYATKTSKVPNRAVRKRWTYTKTLACTITGSIPAEAASKICSIYNTGITFWRYDSSLLVNNKLPVGDYVMTDNAPL